MNTESPTFEQAENPRLSVEIRDEPSIVHLSLCRAALRNYTHDKTAHRDTEIPIPDTVVSTRDREILEELCEIADIETIYNAAFTGTNPDRIASFVQWAQKNKPHISDPEHFCKQVHTLSQSVSDALHALGHAEALADFTRKDIDMRSQDLAVTRNRLSRINHFFGAKTHSKIVILPSDPYTQQDQGWGLACVDGEYAIKSHKDNTNNQDHEFAHSIINPIVEKMLTHMHSDNFQSILNLSDHRLRQDYGDDPGSLLAEELVRTYNTYIKNEEELVTSDSFFDRVRSVSEDDFDRLYADATISFRSKCTEAGIRNYQEFQSKALVYYRLHEMPSALQKIIFTLYKDYSDQSTLSFEDFALQNLEARILQGDASQPKE